MKTRKSLRISATMYKDLLYKNLNHKYYFNSMNTLRKVDKNFLELTLENGISLEDFVTPPLSLNIQLPYPITLAFPNDCIGDPSLDLLRKKDCYQEKINTYINRYKKDMKWLTVKYVKKLKYGLLPKYMLDLSQGIINDPDPHFTGSYNWYYSGGVLGSFLLDDALNFIYSDNRNTLRVCDLGNPENVTQVSTIEQEPIFSIKSYENKFLSVRMKNKAYILSINHNFKILYKNVSDVPYVDVKYHNKEVGLLQINHKLKLASINEKKQFFSHTFDKIKNSTDSFAQISFLDDSNVLFMDRDTLRILDKRSSMEKSFVPQRNYFICDEFSGMCTSQLDDNYLYLSSVHNLYKFDLREMQIVKSWSHMLSSPPLIVKCQEWSGNDVVFLTTQSYKDRVVLCCNDKEIGLVKSVPNALDSFDELNRSGFGLLDDCKNRLKLSTIGADIVNNNNGIDIYCCNSGGDIYKNEITSLMNSPTPSLEKFQSWINLLPKCTKAVNVTSIREMSAAKLLINQPTKMNELDRYTKDNNKLLPLFEEIDTSDIDMAMIWKPERTDPDGTHDVMPPSMTPNHKVTEWLQSADHNNTDDDNTRHSLNISNLSFLY